MVITESTKAKNHLPVVPTWKQEYKAISTLNYFSFTCFSQGGILQRASFLKQPVNHNVGKLKQKSSAGNHVFSITGGGSRGGIAVGEHVWGKASSRVCDVLA